MTKRRTQAQRTAASDSAIFKAAMKLIAREGPNAMTMAKVGKEAGFTGGLVSYRFGSKSGLLKAVSEKILNDWEARLIPNANIEEAEIKGIALLKEISNQYLNYIGKRTHFMVALHRLMNASYGTLPELLPYFEAYDEKIRGYVIKILESETRIKKDTNKEAFAICFIGALRGIAVQSFISKDNVDLNQALKTLNLMIDDAVTP